MASHYANPPLRQLPGGSGELPKMESGHTILLIQPQQEKVTRTWFAFDTLVDALVGMCTLFENALRDLNPGLSELTYQVEDLLQWVDSLCDITMMVSESPKKYKGFGKQIIKALLFKHMEQVAAARQRRQ